MLGFEYILTNGGVGVTISTAITAIQLKAGINGPVEILRFSLTQSSSTTSAQVLAGLVRKTAAATVTAATAGTHLLKGNPANPTSDASLGTSATGYTASAEGTNGEIPVLRGFNVLNGLEWLPTPEERIVVPQGGIIGVTFLSVPPSATWVATMAFRELRGG
jgi:hypothetical protein